MHTPGFKRRCLATVRNILAVAMLFAFGVAALPAHAQSLPSSQDSLLSGPRFLPAEQAFSLYTSLPAPGLVKVHWNIAPGYYMYKDKFSISTVIDGQTVELALLLPEGVDHSDEFFGDVQVYFHEVVAQLELNDVELEGEITLRVQYQGCAEAGFCYTLQQQEIPLLL